MANQETGPHRSSSPAAAAALKLLCSYGGIILPRRPDGRLRYVGGLTRILAVDRSVSYAELMAKLVEFCGVSVALRCELPGGDLETLVSIKSDEDLANLIEEYDEASLRSRSSSCPPPPPGAPLKIRAVLFEPRPRKQASPPPSQLLSPSAAASSSSSSPRESARRGTGDRSFSPMIAAGAGCRGGSPVVIGRRYRSFYGPGLPGVACAAAHCRRNYCQ